MVTGQQAVHHYSECSTEAERLRAKFRALGDKIEAVGEGVNEAMRVTRTDLASAYIGPSLTAEGLQAAEKKSGFRGFTKRDPLAAMAHEKTILERAIVRIRADERYIRRSFLVGSGGELTLRLEECLELLGPWQEECARFESLAGFVDLLNAGYDTPSWTGKFWQPQYWVQWKQGDAICERLEMDDFGDDVLPAYRPIAAKRVEWQAQVDAASAKVDDVHNLVREHDAAVGAIPKLPEVYLAASAKVLGDFLERADVELLSEWVAADDRPVLAALHRLAGLRAKARFLEELHSGVNDIVEDLSTRWRKYRRKESKFRRPKNYNRRHPESVLDLKFLSKLPKFDKRHEKLLRQVAKIETFDAYGAFDLSNEPELWWVVMTGKKPSAMTPSLRGWYNRNSHRSPILREGARDEVARAVAEAAMAAAEEDDLGYVS